MKTPHSSRAAIAVCAVLWSLANPSALYAAYTSTIVGTTATMIGDATGERLDISEAGGLFRHNRFALGDPGFNSDADFDSTIAGDQTLLSATGVININAGDGADQVVLLVDIRGTVDGGPGNDNLDFFFMSSPVSANLGLGTTGMSATLGADQENPATTHAGTGTATVSNYNVVTRTFDINVSVSDLPPATVTGFHIHQAAVGVNGPIIVDFGAGPLVPSGTGFTFSATGLTLPAASEAAFLGGGTYVNIHTGTFPGGAIRGQLFSNGNVNLSTGRATGTASVLGFELLSGGSGNDSLVGNSGANTILGQGGADWIVGGPGSDILDGGAGADVLVWSNGDGTDVDDGGADADTVHVNGNVSNDDVFRAAAGTAGRLLFQRTSAGPFSLDIGTVETLTVNGIGGNDTMTVDTLTGVTSLSALNVHGFAGNDTAVIVPTTTGAIAINVHGGSGSDTLTGPDGAATWNITGPDAGNITGLVNTFRFVEVLNGGSANDTFNLRAFATGTATTVAGGGGTDTLNYDAESRTVSGDTTPPDGVIDSPGVQSVTFSTVEAINILNSTSVPTTVNDSYSTSINTPLTVPAPGVLSNDNSNGGGAMTAGLVSTVSNGTLTLNANGSFTYTPNALFVGNDSFTYRASNTNGVGNVATVSIVVGPAAPITVADTFNPNRNTTLTIAPPGVLANDNSNGAGPMTAELMTTVAYGTLSLSADGGFTYTPTSGFTGVDSFTYRAVNVVGPGNTATVTINVIDPTTPQPPTGLFAWSIIGNLVTFRWTAPVAGPNPTEFIIEGGVLSGQVLASLRTGSTAPVFTVTVPDGAFYVRAITAVGSQRSAPSNEIRIFVNQAVPPSAPVDLLANVNGSSVDLAWVNTFGGGSPDTLILDVTGSFTGSIPVARTDQLWCVQPTRVAPARRRTPSPSPFRAYVWARRCRPITSWSTGSAAPSTRSGSRRRADQRRHVTCCM
jgi:Ca2+-binding RTX toxin-like protein